MKRIVTVAVLATQLAACATAPSKISGSYVSPAMYSTYDCAQLRAEMQRIAYKVEEVTGAQQSKARNDQIAMGVGLILFWPALFFLASGSDRKAELQSLKGSYDAINEASIIHKCGLPSEPRETAAAPTILPAVVPQAQTVAPKVALAHTATIAPKQEPRKRCAVQSTINPDAVTC